ncbi:MAG TPA: MFS transporter [Candidatus Baltobacteraceae bacterium]|nr:MFS transporter [Candidatus Baltobacteraceae bacterium]
MPPRLLAIVALIGLSIFINYIDRGNLATAATLVKQELHLSPSQLGLLLTAFFITYMPLQPFIGWLVDKFTASRVLVIGFLVWSLATLLTAFAGGFAALFVCRLLLGVGESVSFPSMSKILADNVSEPQRGFANGIVMAGLAFGPAFGIFTGATLIALFGWRPFFIGCGVISVLWIVAWQVTSRGHLRSTSASQSADAPDLAMVLREPTLWGASVAHFCSNFLLYFILTWIPYYLVHERHWTLPEMGRIGGTAALLSGIAMIACGVVSDLLIRNGASPTLVRKAAFAIGGLGAAIGMLGCGYSHDASVSAAWLMFEGFFGGLLGVNTYVIAQTKAGMAATGKWVGIQNMIANGAGLIAPSLTGVLVEATGNFTLPFTIAAIAAFGSGTAWTLLTGRIEPIDWKARALAAATPEFTG